MKLFLLSKGVEYKGGEYGEIYKIMYIYSSTFRRMGILDREDLSEKGRPQELTKLDIYERREFFYFYF